MEGKPGQTGDDLERELFIVRKLVEKAKVAKMPSEFAPDFYICTLSNRTIVYKVGRMGCRTWTSCGIWWLGIGAGRKMGGVGWNRVAESCTCVYKLLSV